MSLADLPNGRDLGGIKTAHGTIAPGLVLRGAAPRTDAARAALTALAVDVVVDLRTPQEREQQPTNLPDAVRGQVADVLADASYAGAANLGQLAGHALAGRETVDGFGNRDLRAIMLDSYRDFVELGSGQRATADVLRMIADPATGPVLFHCTAGKDRTGWLTAVLLHTLGTDWDTIVADYLRSGPAVHAMFAEYLTRLPDPAAVEDLLQPVLGVSADYLNAARSAAERTHGSLDGFIATGLGIDDGTIAALRAKLLIAG